jgi:endonuclease III
MNVFPASTAAQELTKTEHRRISGRRCLPTDRFGVFSDHSAQSSISASQTFFSGSQSSFSAAQSFVSAAPVTARGRATSPIGVDVDVVTVLEGCPVPLPVDKPRIRIHIVPPSPAKPEPASVEEQPKTITEEQPKTTTTTTRKKTTKKRTTKKKRTTSSVSPAPARTKLKPTHPPPANPNPEATPERPLTLRSLPCLPKGDFPSWKQFLLNGGYVLSPNKQQQVLAFVSPISNPTLEDTWRYGFRERQVKFHNRIKNLRQEFGDAPRDLWETCLPDKSKDWYEFAVLFLMICSSVIPDYKLVPFMLQLFCEFDVTPDFVLLKQKEDSFFWEKRLQPLGRHVSNAKCIIAAAKATLALGRVPRNYQAIVQHYKGVGPKMALVTVHTAYNDVVSPFHYTTLHSVHTSSPFFPPFLLARSSYR